MPPATNETKPQDDGRGTVRTYETGGLFHHHRARLYPRRGGSGGRPPSKADRRAGLDVWEDEPPPHDHPLMAFDNVIVSPHVAGSTIEARENMGRIAAEQALGILDGKKPPRLINPEVWPAYRERFERIMGFAPEA
jgi:D-isomer specific 2-hydroxyacid dehydrogenase, NAD binding domain